MSVCVCVHTYVLVCLVCVHLSGCVFVCLGVGSYRTVDRCIYVLILSMAHFIFGIDYNMLVFWCICSFMYNICEFTVDMNLL